MDKFQFYDSPIKREDKLLSRGNSQLFQFYDSPIKSFPETKNRVQR